MREIKFRGKRPNSGKWIYGYLYEDGIYSYILHPEHFKSPECSCEVVTETVGQYTGLKDKNGNEIYEGDIVNVPQGYIGDCRYKKAVGVVMYEAPEFWINSKNWSDYQWSQLEVIGNIHDNPELI